MLPCHTIRYVILLFRCFHADTLRHLIFRRHFSITRHFAAAIARFHYDFSPLSLLSDFLSPLMPPLSLISYAPIRFSLSPLCRLIRGSAFYDASSRDKAYAAFHA